MARNATRLLRLTLKSASSLQFPMFRWHQSKLFPNEQYPCASSYSGGILWSPIAMFCLVRDATSPPHLQEACPALPFYFLSRTRRPRNSDPRSAGRMSFNPVKLQTADRHTFEPLLVRHADLWYLTSDLSTNSILSKDLDKLPRPIASLNSLRAPYAWITSQILLTYARQKCCCSAK